MKNMGAVCGEPITNASDSIELIDHHSNISARDYVKNSARDTAAVVVGYNEIIAKREIES